MQDDDARHHNLAQNIRTIRRAVWRETILGMMGQLGKLDLSFTQFATLLYLEAEGEVSLTAIAEVLTRSLAATSRMVDGLVRRGFVVRQEDPSDRRVKQLRLSDEGRRFLAAVEQRRVEAQLAVMDFLLASEYERVAQAMDLLAQAAARRAQNEHYERNTARREPEAISERG